MAQTKKKRNRKQRGTQAGNIDTRRKARPKNRAEARAQAKSNGKGGGGRSRASAVIDRPPTWRGAFFRGLIAAGVFVVLLLVLFKKPAGGSLLIGVAMLALYVPAGYYMDTVMWRRRERARIRARNKG